MTAAFAYPLALSALLAVPLLLGIYCLRRRHRSRVVSSLLLWQEPRRPRQGGRCLQAPRLSLLFLLECLAVLLLVLAAAGPQRSRSGIYCPLTVVLDDSASMRAGSPGATVRERALQALDTELRRGRYSSVRLIFAGVRPTSLGPAVAPGDVSPRLRGWRCLGPAADLAAALALARELGDKAERILVLTDSAPPEGCVGGRIRWVALGQPLANAGITAAARSRSGGHDRCLIEVQNPSSEALRTELALVDVSGAGVHREALDLAAGETRCFRLEIPAATASVEALLAPDALEADNHALLLAPARRQARVRTALADARLAALAGDALAATGLVAAAEAAPPDLIVTDQPVADSATGGAWVVLLLRPAAPAAFVGPFVLDLDHPLTVGLALDTVVWGGGTVGELPGLPVLSAGNTVLLADRELPQGRHELRLVLDPALSTLQQTPNWPILIWNLVDWRVRALPGFGQRQVRVGGELAIRLGPETRPARLIDPDGRVEELVAPAGQATAAAALPGVYVLATDGWRDECACNLLAPGESDLSSCGSGVWGDWGERESRQQEEVSLAWLPGILALVVLGVHGVLAAAAADRPN
jgi:hypothetical protein